ncbi:MAG: HAD-IA family hydrolase [Bacillota bacterium]
MSIKAVLFDLDGTLIDSLPLIRYSFRKVFEDMGIPWDERRVMDTVGLPLRQVARDFAGDRADAFFELYLAHQMKKHDQYIKLFPGTAEMMARVKELGLRTGIVTSKRRVMAERAVKLVSISQLVDVMVALEDCGAHKPDPLPVTTALGLLGVLPGEALYVGDSWYDMESGNSAGVVTVGVTWGMADRPRLSRCNPGFIAGGWEEFLLYLEDMMSECEK